MIAAAAQTVPKHSIEENIADHVRLAWLASEHKADIIVFPELSITGYQMEAAAAMAFKPGDERLDTLKIISREAQITIIAGAPIFVNDVLHIGSFIIDPAGNHQLYTKQYLHIGEDKFYQPGFTYDPQIVLNSENISFAICADITNPLHAAAAANRNTTLYMPSIFYTPGGIEEGHLRLSKYAGDHHMHVLMANYGGPSWGYEAGGRSACWNNRGILMGVASDKGEGLLLARKNENNWDCFFVPTAL